MSQGNEEVLLVVLARFGHPDECHAGHTHAQRCGNEEVLLVFFALLGLVILTSAMQVIRMLRGAQDPGPAFRLDRRSGSFTANSDTHVSHLSHSSLHHMLGGFAAAGTDLLK